MPVAQTKIRTSLAIGLAAIIAAAGLFALVAILTRSDVSFGPDKFEVGSAESLMKTIADDGRPILLGDLSGGDRPIWVQHVGDDHRTGWYAFEAIVARCGIEWDEVARDFFNVCNDARYPQDGAGLTQYPVTVDDGEVVVDLNPSDVGESD